MENMKMSSICINTFINYGIYIDDNESFLISNQAQSVNGNDRKFIAIFSCFLFFHFEYLNIKICLNILLPLICIQIIIEKSHKKSS